MTTTGTIRQAIIAQLATVGVAVKNASYIKIKAGRAVMVYLGDKDAATAAQGAVGGTVTTDGNIKFDRA